MRILLHCVVGLFLADLLGDGKQPAAKDRPAVSAKERELAEVVRAIEAKEKELDALRRKADALRQEIISLKSAGDADVFTSPEQLVAGLPENARPRNANEVIHMNRANDWLQAHVVGKRIQWEYYVGTPHLVRVRKPKEYSVFWEGIRTKNRHKLHGSDWLVRVTSDMAPGRLPGIEVLVDEAAAERLERVSKQAVKLSATIRRAHFGPDGGAGGSVLTVTASDFTIDGIQTTSPPVFKGFDGPRQGRPPKGQ